MTTYYLDSSALVKRYVNEASSDWIQALCTPAAGHTLALAHIGLVEPAAALAMKVRRGTLDANVRDALLRDVQHDAEAQY
jgi:predicted nucleic acid-binding protein